MDVNKQSQQAGEGSQLVQADTIVINQGVSEERVRTIFNEMVPRALEEYTKEASAKANERITNWGNSVLPRVNEVEGMLEAFADPAFQRVLRKAQQSAAVTDEKADYDLLTELLVCHVQKGTNRKNRASILEATEVVDQIDNDALCALTVVHAIASLIPTAGRCSEGLDALEKIFEKLVYCGLPIGNDWLDHLDGLKLIRMNTWGSMRKFSDYYARQLNGYICVGIEKNTSEYHKALEILNDARIATEILIDNELLENYVRLAIHGKSQIDYKRTIHREDLIAWPQEQLEAMWKVWELYSSDETKLETVKENFIKLWDRHPVLHTVRDWWEHIPGTLDITRTGKIIAHTNVKRCDPTIPDLEL